MAKNQNANPSPTDDLGYYIRRAEQDYAVANTTVSQVSNLSVPVYTGKAYAFEANLLLTTHVSGGAKFSLGGTCTAASLGCQVTLVSAAATCIGLDPIGSLSASATSAGAYDAAFIRGTIVVENEGTLAIEFGQAANNSTSSILENSNFIVRGI